MDQQARWWENEHSYFTHHSRPAFVAHFQEFFHLRTYQARRLAQVVLRLHRPCNWTIVSGNTTGNTSLAFSSVNLVPRCPSHHTAGSCPFTVWVCEAESSLLHPSHWTSASWHEGSVRVSRTTQRDSVSSQHSGFAPSSIQTEWSIPTTSSGGASWVHLHHPVGVSVLSTPQQMIQGRIFPLFSKVVTSRRPWPLHQSLSDRADILKASFSGCPVFATLRRPSWSDSVLNTVVARHPGASTWYDRSLRSSYVYSLPCGWLGSHSQGMLVWMEL